MATVNPKIGEIYKPIYEDGEKPYLSGTHYDGNFFKITRDEDSDSINGQWFQTFTEAKRYSGDNSNWYINREHWHKLELVSTSTISPNFIMSVVQKFRDSLLSSEEKTFRKAGLKDDCGNWTDEARQIWIEEQMSLPENKKILEEKALAVIEEEEKKKEK